MIISAFDRVENIEGKGDFSFSHNVFKRLLSQTRQKVSLFGNELSPGFYVSHHNSFENTLGKGEIAHSIQVLLFPQCFLPFWRTFCPFHQIQNGRLQTHSVWKCLKFVIWERVNAISNIISVIIIRMAKGSIYAFLEFL